MINTENKTVHEVYSELVAILKENGIYNEIDYFSSMSYKGKEIFPKYRWVGCFAIEGGNEGHYIHVETIDVEGIRALLYVGKTFEGLDHALKLSNMLTKAFYN